MNNDPHEDTYWNHAGETILHWRVDGQTDDQIRQRLLEQGTGEKEIAAMFAHAANMERKQREEHPDG